MLVSFAMDDTTPDRIRLLACHIRASTARSSFCSAEDSWDSSGKRGVFGSLFLGSVLSRKIPGTIPGNMPRFQSATVVLQSDEWHSHLIVEMARGLLAGLKLLSAQRVELRAEVEIAW